MAFAPGATKASSADPVPETGEGAHVDAPDLRWFVFALFFIFGGITSLNDIIIPKMKELFTLDHATAMLVQSAFFLAYALFSIPAAAIVRPERIALAALGEGVPGRVAARVFQGSHWMFSVATEGAPVTVIRQNNGVAVPAEGEAVALRWEAADMLLRPAAP